MDYDWHRCEVAPDLPESLPPVPEGLAGEWWAAEAGDGCDLVVFVTGDGGTAPCLITVYVIPPRGPLPRRGPVWRNVDRFPRIEELWAIASRFAPTGALFGPVGAGLLPVIAVSEEGAPEWPFRAGDGGAYQLVQMGAVPGSSADLRARLANGVRGPRPLAPGHLR